MNRVDMNYACYKIYGEKSKQSNKNLLSDLLNEVASAIGFDMRYLRENKSEAQGYSFQEEDIDLLEKMAEAAKSPEGKRIRCKDFSERNVDTLVFFFEAFTTLAEHNGMTEEEYVSQGFKIFDKTNFAGLKKELGEMSEELKYDLEHFYFAPNDYLENEDDELTRGDKYMFLLYAHQGLKFVERKQLRAVYFLLKENRLALNNKAMMESLHSMSDEDKNAFVDKVRHLANYDIELHEDEEYAEVLREMVHIESGNGKLQDRKKLKGLALQLSDIMDRHADGHLTKEEYTYGEPDFKKKKLEIEDIKAELDESTELLKDAIQFYYGIKAYRENNPVTPDDERIIEILYRERFGEDMI